MGMKLDAYRKAKNLSASEFGRRIGVAHTTVARWETGELFPSATMMAKIIEETRGEVTPNDLFHPPASQLVPHTSEAV